MPNYDGEMPNYGGTMPNKLKESAGLTEQEQLIVNYIKEKKETTTALAVELLEVKERRARDILVSLTKRNILQKTGTIKNAVYKQGKSLISDYMYFK